MDDATYNAMKEVIDTLTLQNKQLKRANLNLKRERKQLARKLKKINDDQAKKQKQFYKNGKRGGKFNG